MKNDKCEICDKEGVGSVNFVELAKGIDTTLICIEIEKRGKCIYVCSACKDKYNLHGQEGKRVKQIKRSREHEC
jgi:hypothetical protein